MWGCGVRWGKSPGRWGQGGVTGVGAGVAKAHQIKLAGQGAVWGKNPHNGGQRKGSKNTNRGRGRTNCSILSGLGRLAQFQTVLPLGKCMSAWLGISINNGGQQTHQPTRCWGIWPICKGARVTMASFLTAWGRVFSWVGWGSFNK